VGRQSQDLAAPGIALREQLIQIAYARAASQGKGENMELLYQYLSGEEFRQRVAAIVEAFTAMQAQVQRERRAMKKQRAGREKQIQRVIRGWHLGGVRGPAGDRRWGLAAIPAFELDAGLMLEGTEGE